MLALLAMQSDNLLTLKVLDEFGLAYIMKPLTITQVRQFNTPEKVNFPNTLISLSWDTAIKKYSGY